MAGQQTWGVWTAGAGSWAWGARTTGTPSHPWPREASALRKSHLSLSLSKSTHSFIINKNRVINMHSDRKASNELTTRNYSKAKNYTLFIYILPFSFHLVGLQEQEGSLSSSHFLISFFLKKMFFPLLQPYNKPLKRESDCKYKEGIDGCQEIEGCVSAQTGEGKSKE